MLHDSLGIVARRHCLPYVPPALSKKCPPSGTRAMQGAQSRHSLIKLKLILAWRHCICFSEAVLVFYKAAKSNYGHAANYGQLPGRNLLEFNWWCGWCICFWPRPRENIQLLSKHPKSIDKQLNLISFENITGFLTLTSSRSDLHATRPTWIPSKHPSTEGVKPSIRHFRVSINA